ncbi:hypothetical protein O1611_g3290 [Lasiodiplodia mahajangana]|uniref:Uncharacterized protein n=1 Tax=Lasiodiplodia mahajangana TaxID=1108764 RepID=A0ACC2JS66_9PEZI|nr:hypothetical protein O1611_g3290 [Lasiodiplodia mahajangana]
MTDLPPEQNDREEGLCNLAKSVAMRRYNKPVISFERVKLQGSVSFTLDVAMKDHPNVIVQFREEPLDITPFKTARMLLGNAVPSIEVFDNVAEFCVLMSKIPGETWFNIEVDWEEEQSFIKAAIGLGKLMSLCFVPRDNESIKKHIIPKLQGILTMEIRSGINVTRYFPLVRDLISVSNRLGDLPSFFSHPDLNPMNILADNAGNITGIVDWELSRVLPFGISSWAIHFLAGQFLTLENKEIGFVERPFYERIERAFWEALLQNAPKEVYDQLQSQMDLLQLSVIVGTVVQVLGTHEEKGETNLSDIHVPSLNALPKLLRYRIPFIRGATGKPFDAPEYQIQRHAQPSPERNQRIARLKEKATLAIEMGSENT